MQELFKGGEFLQFVLNEYLVDLAMSKEEKFELLFSSEQWFEDAVECFRLKAGSIQKH